MNKWRSLAISAGGHAAILVLSVIIGLFAHQKSIRQPIKVNLLEPGPVGGNPDGGGVEKKTTPKEIEKKDVPKTKPKVVKKTEEKKEIVTKPKETPKPVYNPKDDMKRLEDFLKTHKLEEVKNTPEIPSNSGSGRNTGSGGKYGGGSGSAYELTIQQIIRNNWMQPGRAIVGPNPPVVLVTIIVDRKGNIISRKVTKSSGIAQLDESALNAVDESNPLPELPTYITGVQKDFELRFIVDN